MLQSRVQLQQLIFNIFEANSINLWKSGEKLVNQSHLDVGRDSRGANVELQALAILLDSRNTLSDIKERIQASWRELIRNVQNAEKNRWRIPATD